MKLKHVFTVLFLVFMCVIALNTAEEAQAAPTYSTLSVQEGSYDKSTGNHSFTFTVSTDATTNFLWVTRVGGGFQEYYTMTNKTYTFIAKWAGEYYAEVSSQGSTTMTSNRIYFHVGAPTGVTLKANGATSGQKFPAGTKIPFTITSDNSGDNGFIYVYKSDGKEYGHYNIGTSRSYNDLAITTPGNYTALVQLWNGVDNTKSSTISFTILGGNLSASLSNTNNVASGAIVHGNVTYQIKVTNNANCTVTNLNLILYAKRNGEDLQPFVISGGNVSTAHGTSVSIVSGDPKSIAAGGSVTINVTINSDNADFDDNNVYTVSLTTVSGTESGHTYGSAITISGSTSTTHQFKPTSGNISVDWTHTATVPSDSIVAGSYTYTITVTNGTNHKIKNVAFTVTMDGTTIVTVGTDGKVSCSSPASCAVTSITNSANSNGTVTLTVTINANNIVDAKQHTFKIGSLSAVADGISGSGSGYSPTAKISATEHKITKAGGSITVGLSSTTVNNNGVGEGDVKYTITLQNGTNHALKDITFVLKDNAGNTLLTVNANGTITVVDNTLVKNANGSTLTVSGSLTDLASGATVTITDIVIDADADVLDDSGRLILTATGNSAANGVAGSLGDSLTYADTSDTFTIMVRHDVDLLVQAGVNTTIDRDKIFAAMNKSGAYGPEKSNGLAANTISAITLTDANGNSISNANITINGSNLTLKLTNEYTEYIIKVTYSGGTVLVPIQVTTVDAGEDKTFVLDYGLPVSIDMATMLNDLRLTGGSYPSITNAVTGFSAAMSGAGASTLNGTFGNFAFENDAFGYTTSKFMDNEDFAYIVILVGGNGTENVDYVNVYKKVSFIPSNVIYYEDTLVGSITYPGGYTLDALGELASIGDSLIQDLPTTGNMGFDDGSYAGATDVMLSGESVQKVTVNDQQVTVSFTFTGTGFELISRVNAKDAATLLIHVTDPSGATKIYPVITRFDPNGNGNAEVYQVPVFRLNNGAHGEYTVAVKGLPKQEFDETGNVTKTETSFIYIDGIRVYNPLGNSDLTNYYGDEKDAEFTNLRDLILAGQGMVAEYTDDVTSFTSGSYYYVATEDKWFTAAMGSVNELGAIGANNEILIRQNAGNHIVVLKVKETSAGAGLLQIGVHDIHDAKFDGSDGANESTSVSYKTTSGWVSLVSGTYSGTEQYYEIDLSQCPTDGEYKIVILQVDSGFASFTNIKHKNVTFGQTGPGVLDIYTTPGYFFDEEGNMCSKDEAGNKKIEVEAGEMVNITELNGILSGNE